MVYVFVSQDDHLALALAHTLLPLLFFMAVKTKLFSTFATASRWKSVTTVKSAMDTVV